MRLRLAAGALIAVLLATSLPATGGASRIKTYVPKDCTKARVKPQRIVFACADFGLYVNHLRWNRWRHSRARGKGVLHEKVCHPSCAGGHFKDYPVKINLRKVKRGRCGGRRVPLFRRAILNFPGKTPADARRVHENYMYCSP